MLIISLSNSHLTNTNQPSYGGCNICDLRMKSAPQPTTGCPTGLDRIKGVLWGLQTDQHASKLTQCYNLHVMILSSVNNIRIFYSKQTIETISIPNLKQQIGLITFICYLAAMVWLCMGEWLTHECPGWKDCWIYNFYLTKEIFVGIKTFLYMISSAIIYSFKCIEAETKLLTCCRRLLEMHVLQWRCLYFDWKFTRIVPMGWSHWQKVGIGLHNGLVPFRRQAISEPILTKFAYTLIHRSV